MCLIWYADAILVQSFTSNLDQNYIFESLESGPKLQFDLWPINFSPKLHFWSKSRVKMQFWSTFKRFECTILVKTWSKTLGQNCIKYLVFKSSSDYKKQTDQLQAELQSIRRDRDKKTSKIQLQSKEISELRFENEKLSSLLTKSESQVTKVYFWAIDYESYSGLQKEAGLGLPGFCRSTKLSKKFQNFKNFLSRN